MHHPWRALSEEHPDWEVRFAELADGVCGETDVIAKVIWLDIRLNQAERRSTLTHEVRHVVRGDFTCDERDEVDVEQAAARLLLPLDRLIAVLPWALNVAEAADELWVDTDMLWARLDHLHPSERAAIRRAFAARDNEETA